MITVDFEASVGLLVAACEEMIAEGERITRDSILAEARTALKEVGLQWTALTGDERYEKKAKQYVRTLFREEIRDGLLERGGV